VEYPPKIFKYGGVMAIPGETNRDAGQGMTAKT
jgi:hypothetical protein